MERITDRANALLAQWKEMSEHETEDYVLETFSRRYGWSVGHTTRELAIANTDSELDYWAHALDGILKTREDVKATIWLARQGH